VPVVSVEANIVKGWCRRTSALKPVGMQGRVRHTIVFVAREAQRRNEETPPSLGLSG